MKHIFDTIHEARAGRAIQFADAGTGLEITYSHTGKTSTYFIEWDRLDSKAKILEWATHLSEKDWMFAPAISSFIKVSTGKHNINLWVNA